MSLRYRGALHRPYMGAGEKALACGFCASSQQLSAASLLHSSGEHLVPQGLEEQAWASGGPGLGLWPGCHDHVICGKRSPRCPERRIAAVAMSVGVSCPGPSGIGQQNPGK